ncbi:hypothetical protein ACFFIF_01225 [Vagococcus entomophilus]|uniref:Uncharacterized protein n=1 Tax=Vagococcus entomophilus TaxID=1160095 RepID=A0A430AKC3_9ENTE|nr:hypothetical protein [Vagococcus entomophilus]RSU08560.1 hypothetical protein CBF30_04835 [Vagococcus entomophilus]
MKNIFDQFDKEDFYMIEFKMKEYGRSIGSFIVLNILWPWIHLLFNIYIIVVLSGVFTEGQPILYLVFLVASFIYMIQSLFMYFRRKNRSNVLKQARHYFKTFVLICLTLVILGFSISVDNNEELIYSLSESNKIGSILNILLGVLLITIVLSFIFMFLKLKLKLYRKNDSKESKIQLYNALSIAALPVATSIVFFINLFRQAHFSSIDSIDKVFPLVCIIGAYFGASCSADFYMVYYLRKRFPEDFVKEDQMEEE